MGHNQSNKIHKEISREFPRTVDEKMMSENTGIFITNPLKVKVILSVGIPRPAGWL